MVRSSYKTNSANFISILVLIFVLKGLTCKIPLRASKLQAQIWQTVKFIFNMKTYVPSLINESHMKDIYTYDKVNAIAMDNNQIEWYNTLKLGLPRWRVVLVIKNQPANAGDAGDTSSIPGSGRSLGEGNGSPLQYSCLENPMDRGAWGAAVHGVTELDMTGWTHTQYSQARLEY